MAKEGKITITNMVYGLGAEIWSFSTIEESTCVFNGDVILQTQQEVDDFGSQNYCEITCVYEDNPDDVKGIAFEQF